MIQKTNIYFNEKLHKYTDDMDNPYTSVTTVIDRYHEKFDRQTESLKCMRRYFNKEGHKYYRMTQKDILKSWESITEIACDNGNMKHDYLEQAIKGANGYKKIEGRFINDQIYTIDSIMNDHNYGEVDIQYFIDMGLSERYPQIFNVILLHHNLGFRLYAEIGVYSVEHLISGLIDLLAVNFEKGIFRVLDWKTNKDDLYFTSGYIKKDRYGNPTGLFIHQDKRMLPPINNLQYCKGILYTLQLSLYAHLVSMRGLTCDGIYLCHIRKPQIEGDLEDVQWHNIKFLQTDIIRMITHFYQSIRSGINMQTKMIIN